VGQNYQQWRLSADIYQSHSELDHGSSRQILASDTFVFNYTTAEMTLQWYL